MVVNGVVVDKIIVVDLVVVDDVDVCGVVNIVVVSMLVVVNRVVVVNEPDVAVAVVDKVSIAVVDEGLSLPRSKGSPHKSQMIVLTMTPSMSMTDTTEDTF